MRLTIAASLAAKPADTHASRGRFVFQVAGK